MIGLVGKPGYFNWRFMLVEWPVEWSLIACIRTMVTLRSMKLVNCQLKSFFLEYKIPKLRTRWKKKLEKFQQKVLNGCLISRNFWLFFYNEYFDEPHNFDPSFSIVGKERLKNFEFLLLVEKNYRKFPKNSRISFTLNKCSLKFIQTNSSKSLFLIEKKNGWKFRKLRKLKLLRTSSTLHWCFCKFLK